MRPNEAGSCITFLTLLDAKPAMIQRFFGLLTWVRLDHDQDELDLLGLHNPVGNHASLSIMQDGDQSAGQ